jgi:HlyD family secretion protein
MLVIGGTMGGAAGGFLASQIWGGDPSESPSTAGARLARRPAFGKLRSGAPQERVAALGRLEPRGEVIEIGGLPGDRLRRLEVREGDRVKEDDVLGYLDSHAVRLAQSEAAEAQLADARARQEAEVAVATARLEEAQVGLRRARQLGPLDIEAQQAQVRLLESTLATAESDLQRLRKVNVPGAVSAQQMDQYVLAVRRGTEELAAARETLAKARAGHELNLQHATTKITEAEAALRQARAGAQIESLTKNVALANAELARTILRAPRDGTILQIVARPGERLDQQPILRMGDTSVMYVLAEVYETDLPLVRPGQAVHVTSAALSVPLTGTVERVGQLIRRNNLLHLDPGADADARVAQVWARLAPSEEAARLTNLRVDVEIDVL